MLIIDLLLEMVASRAATPTDGEDRPPTMQQQLKGGQPCPRQDCSKNEMRRTQVLDGNRRTNSK